MKKWKTPCEVKRIDEIEEELQSITVHFGKGTSHYAVLWMVVEALAKKKFASRHEILTEWHTLIGVNK